MSIFKRKKRVPKSALKRERKALEERQEYLREKYQFLLEAYAKKLSQYDDEVAKGEEADEATKTTIKQKLVTIKKLKEEIESEYDSNFDRIEQISKIVKNDDDRFDTNATTAVSALCSVGAVGLGVWTAKKAYESDTEGTLVNKKTLDVLNRLNPLKILGKH